MSTLIRRASRRVPSIVPRHAGNLQRMATTDEHRTIAPIVGPDDPAAVHRLRDRDQAAVQRGATSRTTSRSASASRASTRTRAASTPTCTASSCGRCASTPATQRQGIQRALPLPARARLDRAEHGVRPAHPARPGLRQPALPGRGRPHRRGDRHDRRHAHGVRRDPAGPGVDVDDDQRPGGGAAAALRAGRPRSRASPPSSCAGPPRTTSSRSTSRAGTSSTRPRARSG